MHMHSITNNFPNTIIDELCPLPPMPLETRTDLHHLPLFSIDRLATRIPSVPLLLMIAIIVVAMLYGSRLPMLPNYVPASSMLDKIARAQGNLTYFLNRVVPMLAVVISENLYPL